MSMTYPTREPAPAINTDDAVFVPRYARTARSSKKPVKTWMILAPLGALVVIGGAAFIIGYALMRAVKLTKTLRVSEEGELEGIDIHEHGSPAYHPEAAYMGKGL